EWWCWKYRRYNFSGGVKSDSARHITAPKRMKKGFCWGNLQGLQVMQAGPMRRPLRARVKLAI
ncbi:MAG: hypothetical protein ACK56I_11340, partial [bacterium]